MIKLAVFDLDGTLLDTVPDLTAAMNFALRQMNKPEITTEQARAYIGNGIKMFAKRAISNSYDTDTSDEEADEAVGYFKSYYAEHLTDHTAPYAGMAELVKKLKQNGIKTAVFSNKYDAATKHIIEYFFPGLFDVVHGESDTSPRKPDPAGFFEICKETGCEPEDAVMTGDSPADLMAARNAGTRCICVLWGYRSKEKLLEAGADMLAEDSGELYGLIMKL